MICAPQEGGVPPGIRACHVPAKHMAEGSLLCGLTNHTVEEQRVLSVVEGQLPHRV